LRRRQRLLLLLVVDSLERDRDKMLAELRTAAEATFASQGDKMRQQAKRELEIRAATAKQAMFVRLETAAYAAAHPDQSTDEVTKALQAAWKAKSTEEQEVR